MSPREVLAKHTSRELTEWQAFFELEPWGSEIEDHRFGLMTATIANVNRDPKQKPTPYEPEDFFPPRLSEEEEMEDNADKWRAFIAPFKKGGA